MDVQETSTSLSLVIKHKLVEVGAGCSILPFGLISLLVGLATLLSFDLSTLECQRIEPNQSMCKLNGRDLPGHLRGADLEGGSSPEGGSHVGSSPESGSRVVILTTQGKFPLTNYYSQGIGEDPKQTSKRVNDFVGNPGQAVLQVKQDWHLLSLIFICGGLFTLLGARSTFNAVLLIAGDSKIIWLFDKKSGYLQIIGQSRFIKPQVKQEWPLNEITQVQIVERTDGDGDLCRRLLVSSESDELVQLPVNRHDYQDYDEFKKKINEFLNLRIS